MGCGRGLRQWSSVVETGFSESKMALAISQTHLAGVRLAARGKVRDIYDLGEALLIVATDRVSAFDVVMTEPIPDKGRVLTALSLWWFAQIGHICENHLISAQVDQFPAELRAHREVLEGRAMLVRKAQGKSVV